MHFFATIQKILVPRIQTPGTQEPNTGAQTPGTQEPSIGAQMNQEKIPLSGQFTGHRGRYNACNLGCIDFISI